jgi:hypothetical protein
VLRKAINVGEAVSERLQAFVYEDVRTNRTLLTVRNVGSVGSEVEYLMAVGYDGSVLAEARPGDTIKLGTQQAFTLFLSDLLGPGFDNYTEVRSRMAVLYLKTVKGGVFGSGYMAPPSVMTAAYATFNNHHQHHRDIDHNPPHTNRQGDTNLVDCDRHTGQPRPLAGGGVRRRRVREQVQPSTHQGGEIPRLGATSRSKGKR